MFRDSQNTQGYLVSHQDCHINSAANIHYIVNCKNNTALSKKVFQFCIHLQKILRLSLLPNLSTKCNEYQVQSQCTSYVKVAVSYYSKVTDRCSCLTADSFALRLEPTRALFLQNLIKICYGLQNLSERKIIKLAQYVQHSTCFKGELQVVE